MIDPEPTIFVVDDDPSVRKGVARMLRSAGYNVVVLDSARKLLERYDPMLHGCIVLDVAMPDVSGLELQEALIARNASLPIVFLTGRGDIAMSVRAMKRGAGDFLTKPVRAADLLRAVRAAIEKDRAARSAREELADIRRRLATLTPREYEVFVHVVAGRLNKQTAAELGTVEKTIKVHRAHVMEKMQVQSIAELARLAERAGVIDPVAAV